MIISFETIEHFANVPLFLQNVKQTLKQSGLFLVSTPIVQKTRTECDNPHHMIEWSFYDFQKLIAGYFSIEEIYVQHITLKKGENNSFIYRAIRKIKRDFLKKSEITSPQNPAIEKWTGNIKSIKFLMDTRF